MMVSPTGQFILPCSCPSFLLVNFISENMGKALELLSKYKQYAEFSHLTSFLSHAANFSFLEFQRRLLRLDFKPIVVLEFY